VLIKKRKIEVQEKLKYLKFFGGQSGLKVRRTFMPNPRGFEKLYHRSNRVEKKLHRGSKERGRRQWVHSESGKERFQILNKRNDW
jgi:hypothetical protein